MNREIKFRVWDKDMKCWWCEDSQYLQMDGKKIHPAPWSTLSADLPDERIIVQQYTGLKDKNGVEIYEGDFIQYQYPTNEDCIKLKTKNIVLVRWTTEEEDNHPGFRIVDLWGQYGKMEVIGNIMETPELLKA
jgi:uncharacterized phage protein (TIGR01671 family)